MCERIVGWDPSVESREFCDDLYGFRGGEVDDGELEQECY